jgi:tRNA threonylcarbamoyladenosine biosynthesis protein TsaE
VSVRLVSGGTNITRGLGEALGRVASGPLAILLIGDYGTGKTTFVQGLAVGLGIVGPVRSPSYNIMKVYSGGRIVLVHADLYRTSSIPEIEELGLMEVAGSDAIIAVEWPGRYMPPARTIPTLTVCLGFPPGVPGQEEHPNRRQLEFIWSNNLPQSLQEVLRALAAR